ncbi:MAG: hypothetical protein EOM21_13065 [Gammaproteobacteria bacterium]|nr:hypothetical protein [Gammaproteobacteria bacterium]
MPPDDDPRGLVIGACLTRGLLCYDGRPQGRPLYGETDDAVLEQARAYRDRCYAEPIGREIWPDREAWTVRLYP